jgi:hypothetical protein
MTRSCLTILPIVLVTIARVQATDHWSFVPPEPREPASVHDASWTRGKIDRFVLARLEAEGLPPSREADLTTLIRRLHLDLVGLPPSPSDVDAFVEDASADAYEKLVDRLLASPRFGERWARHWLDLARYADSNGYEDDQFRPDAWRYRDWVVDSIYRDQPFDEFTVEQLAGDLLDRATYEQQVATGFHRMPPANKVGVKSNQEEFRIKTAKERASTTGSVWLGLTIGCAECHDHKYDPISQREYYELFAFFNSTDETEVDAPPLPQSYHVKYDEALAAYRSKPRENGNNEPQPPSSKALVLMERARPRASHVHVRGNFLEKGEPVSSIVPRFLPELRRREKRADRLDLARWIVDPLNPLTARVEANRVWQRLFGFGLVRSPEDFGVEGSRPTHPALLDWLAIRLVERGWSRKSTVRDIVMSSTYRQSSQMRPDHARVDPENRLLARQSRFAVEAEIVRDLALATSGLLAPAIGGPSVQPPLPTLLANATALKNERFREADSGADRYRRGLYINVQRTFVFPSLKTFDAADPNVSCARRERSSSPMQALTLLNEPTFVECARALGLELASLPGDADSRFEYAFRLCLGRVPEPAELTTLRDLVDRLRRLYARRPEAARALTGDENTADAAAWIGVARTIYNLEELITRE